MIKLKQVVVATGVAFALLGVGKGVKADEVTAEHEVVAGDTMGKIADNNGLTLPELADINPQVDNLDVIYVGDIINVAYENEYKPSQEVSNDDLGKHTQEELGQLTEANTSLSVATVNITSSERALLTRLVEAEATGEPYVGKVAVAEVILNRAKSGAFPNSVSGVIYQSGQFSPITDGRINITPTQGTVNAVNEALTGTNYAGGALYFYNPAVSGVIGWFEEMTTTAVIGGHSFKR